MDEPNNPCVHKIIFMNCSHMLAYLALIENFILIWEGKYVFFQHIKDMREYDFPKILQSKDENQTMMMWGNT